MRYLSLCSGIEAASVAWKPLKWEPVAFAEIDKFACALLKYHYPNVPNLGDITASNFLEKIKDKKAIEVIIGGTPCQSFSLGGKRLSLSENRGMLALKYAEIVNKINPPFAIWENVRGVLFTKDNAFGCLLSALCGLNYPIQPVSKKPKEGKRSDIWKWDKGGKKHYPNWPRAGWIIGPKSTIAWRTLDSQFFGVPQRRKRVFLVRSPRGGGDPRKILFEQKSMSRDIKQATQKQSNVKARINASINIKSPRIISHTLPRLAKGYEDGRGRGTPLVIDKETGKVRKLTPVECERLQGFPDNYTNVPYGLKPKFKGQLCADTPRYMAIGESMTVNVIRWLGQRIKKYAD